MAKCAIGITICVVALTGCLRTAPSWEFHFNNCMSRTTQWREATSEQVLFCEGFAERRINERGQRNDR